MSAGWIIGVVAVVLIVAALWATRKRTPMASPAWPGSSSSAGPGWRRENANPRELEALRKHLRIKALGNNDLVERLVEAERVRMPGASESECYRAAIESWERDNR